VQAQAEHRARYPDWRFRPGTNVDAIAKRKTKDKNKDRPPTRRRRNPSARDKDFVAVASAAPTDGGGNDGNTNWGGGGGVGRGGGGGRYKGKRRGIIQERRCAQIAELLARGVKGVELSSAVQAWDKESGVSNVTDGVFVSEQGMQALGADANADAASPSMARKGMRGVKVSAGVVDVEMKETIKVTKTRSMSSAQPPRFNVPLTSMFRRASSVPLVPDNGPAVQGATAIASTSTTASVSPVPDLCPPPLSPASSVSYGSEVSFPDSDSMSVVRLLPLYLTFPFSCVGFFFLFFSLRFNPCSILCPSHHREVHAALMWITRISAFSARLMSAPILTPTPSVSVWDWGLDKARDPNQRPPCRTSSSRITRAIRPSIGPAALVPLVRESSTVPTTTITTRTIPRSPCRPMSVSAKMGAKSKTHFRSCLLLLR
jgi:hypothetical protein